MLVRELKPDLATLARKEINEDPKRLEDGIRILKEWITQQSHLRARTDNQWLAAFLRGSKYSIERAKEKIDLYYTIRTTAPDLYTLKYTDPKFMEIINLGFSLELPLQKPTDPRVILYRPAVYDPNKYTMKDIISVMLIQQQISYLDDDNFMIAGVVTITDMQGMSSAHMAQMSIPLMRKMAIVQTSMPLRQKGSHVINMPKAFEAIFNVAKKFHSDKLQKRMHIHSNLESLYKHVSKEILPAEYGGDLGPISEITGSLRNKIQEFSSWLEEDLQYGTDESKRLGKPKTAEDMFGVEGSFRQLDFD